MMKRLALSALAVIAVACAPAPTPAPTSAPPTAAPTSAPTVRPTATSAPTPVPVTLKFGQVGGLSDGAIYIADAKGYFKEQGITLDVTPFASAALMTAPLGTNELQVGGGALSAGLFNAVDRGIALRIVADKGNLNPGNSYEATVVRKDLADAIKGPKDLKGRTFALPARDITPEVTLDTYLRQGGLTIKDVNIVTMGFPDMLAAFRNSAIEAAIVIEPTLSRVLSDGVGVVLTRDDVTVPGQQTAVILYSEKFAQQKEVAVRFMVAYLKGARFYNDAFVKKDPAKRKEAVEILSKATRLEPALFETMYFAGINPNGRVNVKSLGELQDWFVAKGSQLKAIDLNKIVDLSFVEEAVRILGAYQ